MKVPFFNHEYEFPSAELLELRDCNSLLEDRAALLRQFDEDGYLLVRGLHPRKNVMDARRVVYDELAKENQLASGSTLEQALIAPEAKGKFWGGRKGVTHHPAVRNVLEGENVFRLLSTIFGEPCLTFDYKWLRAVGTGDATGAHYDVVYMGRGSTRLMTVWTPLDDVPVELGSLAICVGSHKLPGFDKVRATYGRMDVDRDRVGGWFSDDPKEITGKFGGTWATTNFNAGDAILFGMYTMHASVNNQTNRFRISTDTRFQPAADPVDERWVGENPISHYGWFSEPDKIVSMQTARAQWGV